MDLTKTAASMIADLTARADLPQGGLRIAQTDDTPGLTMAVAPEPDAEDEVIHQHHVAVFLDPIAAGRLAQETLDARHGEAGAAFFLEP